MEKNSAKHFILGCWITKKPKSKFWNCFILIFFFKKCWIKLRIFLDFSLLSDLQTSITQPYNNHKVSAETVQGLCYYTFCCGELCCPSLWSNLNLRPTFEILFCFVLLFKMNGRSNIIQNFAIDGQKRFWGGDNGLKRFVSRKLSTSSYIAHSVAVKDTRRRRNQNKTFFKKLSL